MKDANELEESVEWGAYVLEKAEESRKRREADLSELRARANETLVLSSPHELQVDVNKLATLNGFHEHTYAPGEECCTEQVEIRELQMAGNIMAEAAEIWEELRKGVDPCEVRTSADGKLEGVPIELADVVIRCFDMAAEIGIDLWDVVYQKHRYNLSRPFKHGNKQF